jgi:hypothetical protein
MTVNNSAIIRVNKKDKKLLDQLAIKTGSSIPKVIHELIVDFKNRSFFVGLKSDYAKLKSKRGQWQEHSLDNKLFENAIADGLDDL